MWYESRLICNQPIFNIIINYINFSKIKIRYIDKKDIKVIIYIKELVIVKHKKKEKKYEKEKDKR